MDQNQLSILRRLFSTVVVHEFGRKASSPLFARLVKRLNLPPGCSPQTSVSNLFETGFKILKTSGLRDEYVYRSAIAQKILIGRHSLNTATMLNELRVGTAKADVVVLNGTSTVYEIKSERDSLVRLENQLNNYRQVFAHVNVVTSENHLDTLRRIVPKGVGIIVLSSRFSLRVDQEAVKTTEMMSSDMIFNVLRTREAKKVLENLGICPPKVPNTQVRGCMQEIFMGVDPIAVHDQMVQVLRRSRSQSALTDFVELIPRSLLASALATKPDKRSRERIIEAVNTPLIKAIDWK